MAGLLHRWRGMKNLGVGLLLGGWMAAVGGLAVAGVVAAETVAALRRRWTWDRPTVAGR
ncbi:MAG TPA: hypothetical protein VFD84_04585 [Candidatus Binatia bacterium]|nr:hypothetical protein [Candidatus Binatia bacterium]